MAKLTAQDVADYFLSLVDEDCEEGLTNLKLQKLLYYSQGFHIAIHGVELFGDQIHAWSHGPVVQSVYRKYSEYGANPLPKSEDFDLDKYDTATKELLDEIWEVYGQFSAWKLRNMTHDELPWTNTERNQEIHHSLMKEYFETLLN